MQTLKAAVLASGGGDQRCGPERSVDSVLESLDCSQRKASVKPNPDATLDSFDPSTKEARRIRQNPLMAIGKSDSPGEQEVDSESLHRPLFEGAATIASRNSCARLDRANSPPNSRASYRYRRIKRLWRSERYRPRTYRMTVPLVE